MKLNATAFISLYVLAATLPEGCSAKSLRGGNGASHTDESRYEVAAQLKKAPQMSPRVLSSSDQCDIELEPPLCTKRFTEIPCEEIPLPSDPNDCKVDIQLKYWLRNQSNGAGVTIESFTRMMENGDTLDFLPTLQSHVPPLDTIKPPYNRVAVIEYAKLNVCEERIRRSTIHVTARNSDAEKAGTAPVCSHSINYELVTPVGSDGASQPGTTTKTTQAVDVDVSTTTKTMATTTEKQNQPSTTTETTQSAKRCDLETKLSCVAPGGVSCKDYNPEYWTPPTVVSVTYRYSIRNVGSSAVTLTSFESKRHGTTEDLLQVVEDTVGADLAPMEEKTIERSQEVDFSLENNWYRTNMSVAAEYDLGYGYGSCSASRSMGWM